MLLAAALGGACGEDGPVPEGGVGISIDIPNKALDPKGYTSIEVTMHTPSGDIVRSAAVSNNQFLLGDFDVMQDVWVEAVLRNDSGTAVGYGRTAGPVEITPNAMITVQVRRPIVYVAGLASTDDSGFIEDPNVDIKFETRPATYSDLAVGTNLDGKTRVGSTTAMMIAAGPDLYMVEQAADTTPGLPADPATKLTGPATIKPVSTGDHGVGAALSGTMTGGVRDGAGSDDGKWLVIGTTTALYVVDTTTGMAKSVATGDFARVAIVNAAGGASSALAIKNRGTPCNTSAELVTVDLTGGEVSNAMTVATGGYTDVASDGGRMFVVNACNGGELGEVKNGAVTKLRMALGKPTALAVSNGQAYIGVETASPVGLALVVAGIAGSEAPRQLWAEQSQQVVDATQYPGVQRLMNGTAATFGHLEVGAGGDYIAMTATSHFDANAVAAANFPHLEIDTEELRVFDASSGAPIQRYRSYCDGVIDSQRIQDIESWGCATSTGQTAPSDPNDEHHIQSMTFLFGKK